MMMFLKLFAQVMNLSSCNDKQSLTRLAAVRRGPGPCELFWLYDGRCSTRRPLKMALRSSTIPYGSGNDRYPLPRFCPDHNATGPENGLIYQICAPGRDYGDIGLGAHYLNGRKGAAGR
jgi:hypothetical protein